MPSSQDDAEPIPIDRAALAEISCGDEAAERRLLSVFRAANAVDGTMLDAAMGRRDAPAVNRAAHRLLGAARLAGATVLVDVCSIIMQAGKADDWDAIDTNRDALCRELARINLYLDAQLNVQPDARADFQP
jgi:HPt (histidine-containing phosphotransfer) domain-containing protein